MNDKPFIGHSFEQAFFPRLQCVGYLLQFPANIDIFKANNRNSRKRCEVCSKLTIKTPFSIVSIVEFEQFNVSWVEILGPPASFLVLKEVFHSCNYLVVRYKKEIYLVLYYHTVLSVALYLVFISVAIYVFILVL